MVTASGAALPGVRNTVDITLLFRAYRADGTRLPRPVPYRVDLYDANIGCDAILSCAWLRTHRIRVLPHRGTFIHSLASGEDVYLTGLSHRPEPDP